MAKYEPEVKHEYMKKAGSIAKTKALHEMKKRHAKKMSAPKGMKHEYGPSGSKEGMTYLRHK
jgi:hypothetical protein